jgi:hypothetical protein
MVSGTVSDDKRGRKGLTKGTMKTGKRGTNRVYMKSLNPESNQIHPMKHIDPDRVSMSKVASTMNMTFYVVLWCWPVWVTAGLMSAVV